MFELKLDLEHQFQDHSPTAHRGVIQYALDQARRAVGDGLSMSGDIVDPNQVKIGTWTIRDGGSND